MYLMMSYDALSLINAKVIYIEILLYQKSMKCIHAQSIFLLKTQLKIR